MNFASNLRARALPATGALCALVALAGCQGEKIVAHVGSNSITEKVWSERALKFTQADMRPGTDAGGSALVRLIEEEVVSTLAKEKNVAVTPEEVTQYTRYQTRINPQSKKAIADGLVEAVDFEPTFRYELQLHRLGATTPAPKDDEIQKEYDDLKKQDATAQNPMTGQVERNPIKQPETYTLRVLPCPTEAIAKTVLDQLKANGDFKAAVQTAGLPPQQADTVTQERPLETAGLKKQQPAIYEQLSKVQDGKFTDAPLQIKGNNPQTGQPSIQYLDVQVVKKEPEYIFPLEEVKTVIIERLREKANPDWQKTSRTLVTDRMDDMIKNNTIQITEKRYVPLIDKVIKKDIEQTRAAAATPPTPPTPQPPPQPTPAPNGGKPTTGGSTPAPTNGGKPTTGGSAPGAKP